MKHFSRNSSLVALSALALLGSGTMMAQAQGIGVNFSGGQNLLVPTDQPGVVPGGNFNTVVGASGSNVGLADSTGAMTTALLTYNSTTVYDGFSGTNTANAATNVLYQGGLAGNNNQLEVSISVSNIPYALYNVYVYASADTTNTSTLSLSDGTTTYYYASDGSFNNSATSLLQTTSTNALNPTIGPGQYQVFSGLSASTFNVTTGGSINGVLSNNVFGLQIVNAAAVPEPAFVAMSSLLALGGGGLLLRWRKTRA